MKTVLASLFLTGLVDGFQLARPFGRSPKSIGMTGFDVFENCGVDGLPDVCVLLDFDGTVVEPGEKLPLKDQEMFGRLKLLGVKVFIVTAQSAQYMLEIVDPALFEGIICECNFDLIKPDGNVVMLQEAQSMLPVQNKIEKCIEAMKWDFQVNRKRGGFALDLKGASEEQVEYLFEKVKRMADCKGMRAVLTAGFIDYMFPAKVQCKALGLRYLKEKYPDYLFFAAGDSVVTDGPMLDVADVAYFVGESSFKEARTISGPKTVLRLLAWIEYLCKQP